MVKKSTKVKNLFKDSALQKYAKYFYYGFSGWEDVKIGAAIPYWPNQETVKSLNLIEKLYNEGKFSIYFFDEKKPDVNIMILKHEKPSKFVLIAAGGGYSCVASAVEATPIGADLYKRGFSVGILTYSICDKARFNGAYKDLIHAINFLLKNEKNLGIIMDKFIIGGCSAGANLVSRYGTNNFGYCKLNMPKPGLMFLAYPVISMTECTHLGSRENLLGKNPTDELINEYSTEKHVDKNYPNTFIWQCERDKEVPFTNSLLMVEALKKAHVPYIFEHYDSDIHGWSVAYHTPAKNWTKRMLKLIEK